MKRVIFFSLILLYHAISFSQWSTDPAVNNPVIGFDTRLPNMVTDGNNGIILVCMTHPIHGLILAQRMSVAGYQMWGDGNGINIVNTPDQQVLYFDHLENQFLLPDDQGGAYIGYQLVRLIGYTHTGDESNELYDFDGCIQHLDANGNRLFGETGFKLMPDEPDSTGRSQKIKYWCSDGYGGLYVTWTRNHGVWGTDVEKDGTYLARISPDGEYIWGPKKMHVTSVSYIPYLDSNLNLNLYFTIGETSTKIPDKFIRINSVDGAILSEREIEIGVGEYGFSAFFDYCSSENNSVIFAFRDFRADTLRIQKLDADGYTQWGNEPVIVRSGLRGYRTFDIESDHLGGAYIYYATKDDTFRLAHYDNTGAKLWDRTSATGGSINGYEKLISVDSNGNVFILVNSRKYLTKINFGGDTLWTSQVTSRDTVISESWSKRILADNLGGCIVAWHEIGRQFYGIRAQRINSNGQLGAPTFVSHPATEKQVDTFQIEGVYPNPFNSSVTVRFTTPLLADLSIKIYNLLGEEVITLYSGKIDEGLHDLQWRSMNSQGERVTSGVYVLVCQSRLFKKSQKILFMK
ncbi:T9SS type A sorting domain-containing protein [candidate division KSB1 bacterium]|nr:T9SS type A sorting domain-containing protein [candidate division KSB1 bacterium]